MSRASLLIHKIEQLEESHAFQIMESMDHSVYCTIIEHLFKPTLEKAITEGIFGDIKSALSSKVLKAFKSVKSVLEKISADFKIGKGELIKALKDKALFGILKAVGFNFKKLLDAFNSLSGLVRDGLLDVFKELVKTKVFQKIRSGAVKVDEVLDKYPILKKVAGIAVAGILLYIWLNMSFIGDADFDFNFSDLAGALAGSFSLADLFASPSGLLMITLFGTGSLLGLSVPWLGKSMYNLIAGLVYTAYTKVRDSDSKLLTSLKSKIKFARV